MKTDSHLIYMRDCVNDLNWFKMRSKYRMFARLLIRYLRNNG